MGNVGHPNGKVPPPELPKDRRARLEWMARMAMHRGQIGAAINAERMLMQLDADEEAERRKNSGAQESALDELKPKE